MLGSAALGTAVGIVALFAVTSLLCSGVTEAISNFMQLRARYLLTGLRAMLDVPESDGTRTQLREAKKDLHEQAVKPASTDQAKRDVTRLLATRNAAPPIPEDARPVAAGNAQAPAASTFTLALYDNPLIKSLQTRRVVTGQLRNPEYISSAVFARALIDTLLPDAIPPQQQPAGGHGDQPAGSSVLEQLFEVSQSLPSGQLKSSVQAFITQAEGDFARFQHSIETWYDDQMALISGWYRRWSRVVLGVVGLIAAILINIDTVQVTHAFYVDAPLRQAVASAVDAGNLCQDVTTAEARRTCADEELSQLKASGLPLGYPSGCDPQSGEWARCWAWSADSKLHWWDSILKLLGWIGTAFAVSFGAPFWFDALSRLGSLRSAGNRPATAATTT